MKVIVPRRNRRPVGEDGGFTVTELIAGLLLSALLLAGLIDVTRRFANSTDRVKLTTAQIRVEHLLDATLQELRRADPGTLIVSPRSLRVTIGAKPVTAEIKQDANGKRVLVWRSPDANRSFALAHDSQFSVSGNVVTLKETEGGRVIAVASPRRTVPFDCRFDTVVRECSK